MFGFGFDESHPQRLGLGHGEAGGFLEVRDMQRSAHIGVEADVVPLAAGAGPEVMPDAGLACQERELKRRNRGGAGHRSLRFGGRVLSDVVKGTGRGRGWDHG
jgi:hypothetical protein